MDDNIRFRFDDKHRWVSDMIGDEYKLWRKRDENDIYSTASRVFIESPTGTGKTYFILRYLLPYAAETGRNILYLGNRSALEAQLKRDLGKSTYSIKADEAEDVTEYKVFLYPEKLVRITVINYQSVIGHMKRGFLSALNHHLFSYYYVIFDEAHFFLEDSLFNSMTWLCLDAILREFHLSVFIFISATLEEFMFVIRELLPDYTQYPLGPIQNSMMKKDIFHYIAEPRPSKYHPYYYTSDKDLLEAISANVFKEKWLIFVTSKQGGRTLAARIDSAKDRLIDQNKSKIRGLKEKLIEKGNEEKKQIRDAIRALNREIERLKKCKISFLSAESKRSCTWKSIVKNSKFNETILITTKVLDNGINIKDREVQHVVLPFCDKTEFIQMLGRRRMEEDETINLYIKYPEEEAVYSRADQYKKLYAAFDVVKELYHRQEYVKSQVDWSYYAKRSKLNKLQDEMTEIMQDYWLKDKSIQNLFFIDNHRNLRINPLADLKLSFLIYFYDDLCEKFNKKD